MQVVFGAGVLYGTQLTDASGNAITNPTPVKFGVLQECGLDISFDTKMLYGNQQFPIAVGRGKGKVSGKAKSAQINGALLNAILFGQTLTPLLQNMIAVDEGPTAIPTTPFTITVTNSATWTNDLGVYNSATGLPLKRVASAPTAGQYSVTAGVYLFSSADNGSGISVKINYGYTLATGGNKSTVANVLMGYAPTFQCDLSLPFQGKNLIVRLNSCVSSKFSLSTKLDDFVIPDFAFEAFADAAGNIMTYSLTE
jgi:hypothetical protein